MLEIADRSRGARALRALAGRGAGGRAHCDRRQRRRTDLRRRPALRHRGAPARGRCARTSRRSSASRSCCPSIRAKRRPSALRIAVRGRCTRSFRSARSRSCRSVRARTRSAARTASAASSSPRTCAGATSARSSPRPSSAFALRSSFRPATGCTWGGQFEQLESASAAPPDRGAARAAADLRNPDCGVRLGALRRARFQRRSARLDGRHRRAARCATSRSRSRRASASSRSRASRC